MNILRFDTVYPFGSNCYMLESCGEAAIIDPSAPYDSIISKLSYKDVSFKYIILTHAHFDHMLCIDDWVKCTGATVITGVGEGSALSDATRNCYKIFGKIDRGYYGEYVEVGEGDVLTIGDETVSIISTPGHTIGSITLCTQDAIFVGDCIFSKNSYGRTDLPGGNYTDLIHSISKILSFPPETDVYPGHGPKTKIIHIK